MGVIVNRLSLGRATRVVLIALCAITSACDKSPTTPSRTVRVAVGLAGTPFSVSFQGRTVTADGVFFFDLAPGDYDMSGTYTSGVFVVTFSKAGSGGVRSGSLRSLQGTSPLVYSCGASWGSVVPAPQSFRLRFTVTDDALAACQ